MWIVRASVIFALALTGLFSIDAYPVDLFTGLHAVVEENFYPPTLDEMSAMAFKFDRNEVDQIIMIVHSNNLALAEVAIQNFDEILRLNGVAFKDFQIISPQLARFRTLSGKWNEIRLRERAGKSQNTLKSLELSQKMLQPSVFLECIRIHFFPAPQILSQPDLHYLLSYLRQKISKSSASSTDIKDYQKFSAQLNAEMRLEIAQNQKLSKSKRIFNWMKEHLLEPILEIKSFRSFSQFRIKIEEIVKKIGARDLAIGYFAGEVAERTVIPAGLYYFAGAKAVALTPFIHMEPVVLAAWVSKQYIQKIRRERALAGSRKNFRLLSSEIARQLRGDPSLTVSRGQLIGDSDIANGPLTFNVVKSHYHRRLPLWFRNWKDHGTRWHDLNLSINELRIILHEPNLAKSLSDFSKPNTGLFADLLITAILTNPSAHLRLRLFLSRRAFSMVDRGQTPLESLEGVSNALRNKVQFFNLQLRGMENQFSQQQLGEIDLSAGLILAVYVSLKANPEFKESDEFWQEVIGLLIDNYPHRRANKVMTAHQKFNLSILVEGLHQLDIQGFENCLSKWARLKSTTPLKLRMSQEKMRSAIQAIINIESQMVQSLSFAPIGKSAFHSQSILDRTHAPIRNLLRDYAQEFGSAEQSFEELEWAFDINQRAIEKIPKDKRVKSSFADAHHYLRSRFANVQTQILKTNFEWASIRYQNEIGTRGDKEDEWPRWEEYLNKFEAEKVKMAELVRQFSEINRLLASPQNPLFESHESLKHRLGEVLEIPDQQNKLGESFFKKLKAKSCSAVLKLLPALFHGKQII